MRYTIILLAVLALAVAAGTAQAQCPNFDILYVEDCGDLPDSSSAIDPAGCTAVNWYFKFTRTSRTTGCCIVHVTINGTDCDTISIDSRDYMPGSYKIRGSCLIIGTPIQSRMELDPVCNSRGVFKDLKLKYKIYSP